MPRPEMAESPLRRLSQARLTAEPQYPAEVRPSVLDMAKRRQLPPEEGAAPVAVPVEPKPTAPGGGAYKYPVIMRVPARGGGLNERGVPEPNPVGACIWNN